MLGLGKVAIALSLIVLVTVPTMGGMTYSPTPQIAQIVDDEEFVGPFSNWLNVKTNGGCAGATGAVGNGVADDTTPLQNCLNALSTSTPTIWLPAGNYKLTSTLTLAGKQFVNIIGADPATTTLTWAGTAGGTMLRLNGVAYSRVSRLTFDGQSSAGVAVDQSWQGSVNYADTQVEYADDVFKNSQIGIRCGNLGFQCSEASVLRGQFLNNSVAGVILKNANALDIFVRYSLFQNNAVGVSNSPGSGNFHVYNSIFEGSTTSDLLIGETGVFNISNNYSSGSALFFTESGITANPAEITLIGNTVLDTTNTSNSLSVFAGNLGTLVMLDNVIRSRSGVTTGPVAQVFGGGNPTGLFSIGNTFTAGTGTCTLSAPAYSSGNCHEVNDQIVARSSINPSRPVLPGTPANQNRTIYEATNVSQIVSGISSAAATCDNSVVHIQPGSYSVSSTIVVPANCKIQIIGDGGSSHLAANGANPVIRLLGPSKVTLRDFAVDGNSDTADGIEIAGADQVGSRVFMAQANLSLSTTNLFVAALDYTNVELQTFYHAYASATGAKSVVVTGGAMAAAGNWQGGATNLFSGASAGNYIAYDVSGGAHVLVRDIWYDDGGGGNQIATVTGAGDFTYSGSALFSPGSGVALNNFQGKAALVNLNTTSNVTLTGNGSGAQVLGLGLLGATDTFFSNTTSPASTVEFLNGQSRESPPSGAGSEDLSEIGCCNTSFLTAALAQLRATQPTLPTPLPAGVTDARLYRVFVNDAKCGIHVHAASSATC